MDKSQLNSLGAQESFTDSESEIDDSGVRDQRPKQRLLANFATDLVADYDVVKARSVLNIRAIEELESVIKARAACEDAYAKGLEKAAAGFKGGILEKGTTKEVMCALRSDLINKSQLHYNLAHQLLTEVHNPLLDLRCVIASRMKRLNAHIAKLRKDCKTYEEKYRKSNTKYHKAYRECAAAVALAIQDGLQPPSLSKYERVARRPSRLARTLLGLGSASQSSSKIEPISTTPTTSSPTPSGSINLPPAPPTAENIIISDSVTQDTPEANGVEGGSVAASACEESGTAEEQANTDPPLNEDKAQFQTESASDSAGCTNPPPSSSSASAPRKLMSATFDKVMGSLHSPATSMSMPSTTSSRDAMVQWLLPTETEKREALSEAAMVALRAAEEARRNCRCAWEALAAQVKVAMHELQGALNECQGVEETMVAELQDSLRKKAVFESSSLANEQYDIQMLFKVMEAVNAEADLSDFIAETSESPHRAAEDSDDSETSDGPMTTGTVSRVLFHFLGLRITSTRTATGGSFIGDTSMLTQPLPPPPLVTPLDELPLCNGEDGSEEPLDAAPLSVFELMELLQYPLLSRSDVEQHLRKERETRAVKDAPGSRSGSPGGNKEGVKEGDTLHSSVGEHEALPLTLPRVVPAAVVSEALTAFKDALEAGQSSIESPVKIGKEEGWSSAQAV